MNWTLLGAGAAVLWLLARRKPQTGQNTALGSAILAEGVPTAGSDFQGTWWERLHGADLVSVVEKPGVALVGTAPSAIGQAEIIASKPQSIGWNGDYNTTAVLPAKAVA